MIRGPSHPLIVLLLLVSSVLGKPDPSQKNGIMKPTIARDADVQVMRGGDVEISLKAIPSYGNMESFVIQTPPLHGTLTDPKNSSDHTATLIYHHDGTKSPLSDSFAFRVKAPGQALSIPANVSIRIIPPPPRLAFNPDVMDFGKVVLSEKRRTNMVITNLGGSRAVGRLLLQSGFSAPNGERYALDEGESVSIPMEFSPMEAKSYEQRVISLPAAHGDSLTLRGLGVPRFEVIPAESSDREKAVEASGGKWRVRNLSDHSLRLSFLSPAGMKGGAVGGWILPPETSLPPNSETNVVLNQEEAEGINSEASLPSKVRISDGLTDSLVELPSPGRFIPVTVQLKSAPEHLSIPMGGTRSLSFTLLNRCDLPKRICWKITSPLGGGMEQPLAVDLHGGETKDIQYYWKPTLPGEGVVHLVVDEGKKNHTELRWKVGVSAETATTPPLQGIAGQMSPVAVSPVPMSPDVMENTDTSSETPSTENPVPMMDGAAVEVSRTWFGKPHLLMRWNESPDTHSSIRIEESLLIPRAGSDGSSRALTMESLSSMNLKLQDLHPLFIKSNAGIKKAIIRGMSPGSHRIILSRVSSDGKLEGRSQFPVYVPYQATWWDLLKLPLGLLVSVLLILFLWRVRRAG